MLAPSSRTASPLAPRGRRGRAPRLASLGAVLAALALLAACSSDSEGSSPSSTTATTTVEGGSSTTQPVDAEGAGAIVFNGQGNNLDAYATEPDTDGSFPTQRVWETVATDPEHGRDINAQICFLPPTPDGDQLYIAGEDTLQDAEGEERRPAGWGLFRLDGAEVGNLESEQVGKLTTTFQSSNDNPENYGCGALSDGRLLTTDVGNQAGGPGDGQLIVWFPPFVGGSYPAFDEVAHCKIDVSLATAQSILVRDDVIYVASARGSVYRYTGPFPTSADAAGGCGKKDATGAPMADEVHKDVFLQAGPHDLATPAGLAMAPEGGFYVSSVFNGVINEYGPDGAFRRTILKPPEGEGPGPKPISTGTPLGIGVGPDGTLYYADIGIVVGEGSVGPGDHTGTLRRIRFDAGEPQPPEVMAEDLEYPDGIGVWVPAGGGGAASKA